MSTVTIEDAQARLSELIEQLHDGEEIVITRDQKPVARLVGESRSEYRNGGILAKLKAVKIDAPADLDLYATGEKRVEDNLH